MAVPLSPDQDKPVDCCSATGHHHSAQDGHHHDEGNTWRAYLPVLLSFILMSSGIVLDYAKPAWFNSYIRLVWYMAAYAPVGLPVLWTGIKAAFRGDIFTEFLLMSLASIGAFFIGEYPEGVAVMVFYTVGELFQDAAVNRAKKNIRSLLDMQPGSASVLRNGRYEVVQPETVLIGDVIQVKAGEKVPLDGEMLSASSSFNTAALTGESKPSAIKKWEQVLAGMINTDRVVEVKVTQPFSNSSMARILELVQNATERKAQTELFIRRFARIYTPVVVLLAAMLVILPYFFVSGYVFHDWLYRALVFLVISCPCALVISIPLGYFGGIGAASNNGILFKGGNYLDVMAGVNTVVMDKTGTLTKGVFKVQEVMPEGIAASELLLLAAAIESKSAHPVANALKGYAVEQGIDYNMVAVSDVEEIPGHGLFGKVNGKAVLAGNQKLMDKFGIHAPAASAAGVNTVVNIAIDGRYSGYIAIADEIKEDAAAAIMELHAIGITQTVMLSGDKATVVSNVAAALKINTAFGDLLPEDKVHKIEELKQDRNRVVAFVGDGINDAPSLALSDVGIAMGGLGSDAAIETADVIIQTDQPSRIAMAIKISKATRRIVWQNIALAFTVKAIVLVLGAGGIATMWEAVFADVGVALLAILNAVRIQRMKF
jgi:Cd2+/Zn2+-exporting ATPase